MNRIVDVVFSQRPVRDSLGVALAVAILIHGGVLVWAARAEPTLESWAANVALAVHDDLAQEDVVTLEEEAPPKKTVEEPPPTFEKTPAARPSTPSEAPPAPAAEAPNVMTSEPDEVVDLSAGTFVKGSAVAPVGGATSNQGTRTEPAKGAPPAVDRSQRVSLAVDDWKCAWPRTAAADIVDAQSVVIKVDVAPSGDVLDARVVKDAAAGFGDAALACAKKTRFQPARDHEGNAVRAWSPPIEVRFSR